MKYWLQSSGELLKCLNATIPTSNSLKTKHLKIKGNFYMLDIR